MSNLVIETCPCGRVYMFVNRRLRLNEWLAVWALRLPDPRVRNDHAPTAECGDRQPRHEEI